MFERCELGSHGWVGDELDEVRRELLEARHLLVKVELVNVFQKTTQRTRLEDPAASQCRDADDCRLGASAALLARHRRRVLRVEPDCQLLLPTCLEIREDLPARRVDGVEGLALGATVPGRESGEGQARDVGRRNVANIVAEGWNGALKEGCLSSNIVDEEQLDRCEAVRAEGRLERGERRAEVLEGLRECEEL